jgi:hypothetical protein
MPIPIAVAFKIAGLADLAKPPENPLFLPYWLLNREEMLSMILGPQAAESVLEQLSGRIEDYNTRAPHSALGMRSPAEYRPELSLSSSR